MSVRHVLPTPWLSIQFSPLSYWWKDYSNGLASYLQLYPIASKTWLKDAWYFTLLFFLFILSFQHQGSTSYYLVLAAAKIPKIWKCTSLDVFFFICKSQDCTINRQWIIQQIKSYLIYLFHSQKSYKTLKHIYIHINWHTGTHTHACICIHMCVYSICICACTYMHNRIYLYCNNKREQNL